MKLSGHISTASANHFAALLFFAALHPLAVLALEEPPGTPQPDCQATQESDTLVKEPPAEPETPPKGCPMCGTWRVDGASRISLKGAQIEITKDRIVIPACGEFEYSKTQPLSESFVARPLKLEVLCRPRQEKEKEDGVRFDVQFGHTFKDHSSASMTLNFESSREPLLTLEAWNLSVLDPCDTGSAMGSVACQEAHNARAITLLATEAQTVPPTATRRSKSLEPFNPYRYASQVLDACIKREAGNGGGNWPYAWALSCQSEHLQIKTLEVLAWNDCLAKGAKVRGGYASYFPEKSTCKPPTEDFDIDTRAHQPPKQPIIIKRRLFRY